MKRESPEQHKEITYHIESDEISRETKERATEKGLEIMREVLSEIDDYFVFASTAVLLRGKKHGIPELQECIPGDLDVAVNSMESLKRIRDRLKRVPGVEFMIKGKVVSSTSSPFERFRDEDTRRLSGVLAVIVDTKNGPAQVNYPFEFFYKSIIFKDANFAKRKEKALGFKTLSLSELRDQYKNNLIFEKRVFKNVMDVTEFLLEPSTEKRLKSFVRNLEQVKGITDQETVDNEATRIFDILGLKVKDIEKFYQTRDKLLAQDRNIDDLVEAMSETFSGFKTKIQKRIETLELLNRVLGTD